MQILILLDIRSMLKKNIRLSNYKISYQLDKIIIKADYSAIIAEIPIL